MYTVRYRPVMDAILNLIEDPDLRGVLNLYPQQCYLCDPHGGPNMRVWTDVHMADDWWSLQVFSPISLLLGFCLYPINPGRLSNQYHTGADRCTPTLPR